MNYTAGWLNSYFNSKPFSAFQFNITNSEYGCCAEKRTAVVLKTMAIVRDSMRTGTHYPVLSYLFYLDQPYQDLSDGMSFSRVYFV